MLKELIYDFMAASEKSWPIYGGGELDRTTKLSSSENMRCIRRLALEKHHPAPVAPEGDKVDWGFAQRGHAVEAWAVDVLEQELLYCGHDLSFHGGGQVSFIHGDLSGTPDGLIRWDDGSHTLVEIKSFDPRKNTRDLEKEPVAQHYAQVQQNMFLIEKNMGIVCENAMILYINASDFSHMIEHDVPYDGGVLAAQMQEKAKLLFSTATEDLPPEGMTKRNGDCDTCPFLEECNRIQGESKVEKSKAPPAMPAFANRTIAATLRRYADAKATLDSTSKVVDVLKQEIIDYATIENVRVIESANLVAKVAEVAGRKSLDTKSYIEASGIDPEPFYKVGKPSIRLTVEQKQK